MDGNEVVLKTRERMSAPDKEILFQVGHLSNIQPRPLLDFSDAVSTLPPPLRMLHLGKNKSPQAFHMSSKSKNNRYNYGGVRSVRRVRKQLRF